MSGCGSGRTGAPLAIASAAAAVASTLAPPAFAAASAAAPAATSSCSPLMHATTAALTAATPCLRIASEHGEPRDFEVNSTSRSSSDSADTSPSFIVPFAESRLRPSPSSSPPSHLSFTSNS